MQESIFTKIINGEIPCHKVYEDDKTLAFLDIDPLMPGNVLVIPKQQVDHIEDLSDEMYQAVWATVKKVSKRVQTVLGSSRAIVLVMGYDVPHAHVHVLPSDNGADFMTAVAARAAPDYTPTEPDYPALAALAKRLTF